MEYVYCAVHSGCLQLIEVNLNISVPMAQEAGSRSVHKPEKRFYRVSNPCHRDPSHAFY